MAHVAADLADRLRGRVVGVIYAGETRTRYGLAIPVSTLRDLLGDRTRLGVPEPCA